MEDKSVCEQLYDARHKLERRVQNLNALHVWYKHSVPYSMQVHQKPRVDIAKSSLYWLDSIGRKAVEVKHTKEGFKVFQGDALKLTTVYLDKPVDAVREVLDQVDSLATRKLAGELLLVFGPTSEHRAPLFDVLCPFANKFPDLRICWKNQGFDDGRTFAVKLAEGKEMNVYYGKEDADELYSLSEDAEDFLEQ